MRGSDPAPAPGDAATGPASVAAPAPSAATDDGVPGASSSGLSADEAAAVAAFASGFSELESASAMKLVILVRMDLKMTPGKIASQCCHVALAAAQTAQEADPVRLIQWQSEGEPIIVLRVKDAAEMAALQRAARTAGLQTNLVSDAGRTEVVPGTQTVLSVGPASATAIDRVTGKLSLL